MSLALIFMVLYQRYQSAVLATIILTNIPLALIGSVIALMLAGQPLSVASMIGFITLAGIAARNGILKISHYINLALFEGETFGPALVVRGSLERLAPVLMTALSAGLALVPLLFGAGEPGREILHPVAVTIFGGLVSSTLLDTLLTPVLFLKFGASRWSESWPRGRSASAHAEPRSRRGLLRSRLETQTERRTVCYANLHSSLGARRPAGRGSGGLRTESGSQRRTGGGNGRPPDRARREPDRADRLPPGGRQAARIQRHDHARRRPARRQDDDDQFRRSAGQAPGRQARRPLEKGAIVVLTGKDHHGDQFNARYVIK